MKATFNHPAPHLHAFRISQFIPMTLLRPEFIYAVAFRTAQIHSATFTFQVVTRQLRANDFHWRLAEKGQRPGFYETRDWLTSSRPGDLRAMIHPMPTTTPKIIAKSRDAKEGDTKLAAHIPRNAHPVAIKVSRFSREQ